MSAVWHRAVVADRADESLAGELEAAAAQSAARGAQATAAAAFEGPRSCPSARRSGAGA